MMIFIQKFTISLNFRTVDLANDDHVTEEFIKINPSSTVPALIDGDFKIFESSAIAIYMVEKYAKDDRLYPRDLEKRTNVNSKLFYVSGYFFSRLYQICVPGYAGIETEIPQTKVDEIIRGYTTVERIFSEHDYLAGDYFSLADLLFMCIMESSIQLIPCESEQYPKINGWLERVRKQPYSEYNKESANSQIQFYKYCVQNAIDERSKQNE
jgi:glutathione S-transferase